MKKIISSTKQGLSIPLETALAVLTSSPEELPDILAATAAIRHRGWGNKISLCSITNAKSGACTEDCAFCSQSAKHQTATNTYSLRSEEEITNAFDEASHLPVNHFGIVTSGDNLKDKDIDTIRSTIDNRKDSKVHWCASLGSLNTGQFSTLKKAGLTRFHHNLETAESFFPSVCSTHAFSDRLETVRNAKKAGLQVCCGGILGIGESLEQRVELALILHREHVDAIPLNFHVPIPGTRLEHIEPMRPLEIIRTIAMFRLVCPDAELKVCAGRCHLHDLQSMIFQAGATGMMIGPLLTIAGREVDVDLQMLKDLELDWDQPNPLPLHETTENHQ